VEELTCVGSFPAITQGASIEATGVYIHHPVYGKQFQISSFTEKMPEDTYGIPVTVSLMCFSPHLLLL